MGYYGSENVDAYDQAIDTVFANHLWLLVLLIPVSAAIMLRDLLQDQVLTQAQMRLMLAIGIIIAGLNLIWLFDADYYGMRGRDIRGGTNKLFSDSGASATARCSTRTMDQQ
mgnify:CR=1 FL=1